MSELELWQEYLNSSFEWPHAKAKVRVTQVKKLELTEFMTDSIEELVQ